MKKLIIVMIALVTISTQAQEKKSRKVKSEKKEMLKDLSPEEFATLKTKKMTLHLDLNESQQREIRKINLEEAKLRKSKREKRKDVDSKPTKEERLEMMNERLDQKIATKKKMKSILNDVQYEKWEKGLKHRGKKRGKRGERGERKNSDKS